MKKALATILSTTLIITTAFSASCKKGEPSAPSFPSSGTILNSERQGSHVSASSQTSVSQSVPAGEVVITQTDPSEDVFDDTSLEWQYDLSFPDWQDRSMYGANNRLGFYGYRNQGKIFVRPGVGSGSFSLYINDTRINTSAMAPGNTYCIDISGISRDGRNSLQLSDLSEGVVKVRIPYPTVIPGTPEEVGISGDAIRLIDSIISCDVRNGFPSAQVAIVKDGKLVYDHAWGNIKDLDGDGNRIDAPQVTSDTLYDLASVTKVFSVNYAIQHLVTQGQLTLDTKIVDILGKEFSENTIDIAYAKYDRISLENNKKWKSELTIRDLLRHQGGFPAGPQYFNDTYDNATQGSAGHDSNILYVGTNADPATRQATLRAICKTPLMYRPGTKLLYSDLDFMILCFCVEKITGMGLDEYLKETFWNPMGLTHITYNPLQNGFSRDNCAATEWISNTRKETYRGARSETIHGIVHDPNAYYCMAGISGHAGLFSNAADLAILGSVMLTGGYGNHRFFSQNVIDQFTSFQDEDYPGYALGWWREGDHKRDNYFGSVTASQAFGHQGFTGTFTMIDPEHNLVVVILTNKLHSKVVDGTSAGNMYTTSTLGFIGQILEIGLSGGKVDKDIWASLAGDMAADTMRKIESEGIEDHDHPRWKAYEALLQAKEMVSQ